MSEAVKVIVRIRPMNSKQLDRSCKSIVQIDQDSNQLTITKPDEVDNTKIFAFDNIFGDKSSQELVYSRTAYNLVENVLKGYNGTIFAYGQTGCGKTHTMVGNINYEEHQGIIPRSFGHILKDISEATDKQFLIRCSFIEIYNEEVRDLLGTDVKAKLEVKQSPQKGVFIKDLSTNNARTHEDLMGFMQTGNKNRSVGQTAMNKDSSRSHLLFMLYLQSGIITEEEDKKYVASKLNLVDLAGSQRLSKTGAAGERLKQAQKINLSLSALGNVISALVDGKSQHIPYRDSKLTRLLQDSLGGNTKTVMIANCSPADYNFDETLSTLRYASRAKFIKNKPIINEDPKDTLLKEYAEQIKKLKKILLSKAGEQTSNVPIDNEINAKLKEKEVQLSNEKLQKNKLLEKIKVLEKLHVEAKDIHIDSNIKERISLIQKNQSIDRDKIQNKKNAKDEISMLLNSQISQDYRKLLQKQKDIIHRLQLEIKDINQENYHEKQFLLEDIRDLTKQNKLFSAVINVLLLPHELDTIKSAAEYILERQQYRIPPFYMKNKQLILPKLNDNQSMDMIREMQENRDICWDSPLRSNDGIINGCSRNSHSKLDSHVELSVKGIIREARNQKIMVNKDDKKNMRKLQLQPIKNSEVREF